MLQTDGFPKSHKCHWRLFRLFFYLFIFISLFPCVVRKAQEVTVCRFKVPYFELVQFRASLTWKFMPLNRRSLFLLSCLSRRVRPSSSLVKTVRKIPWISRLFFPDAADQIFMFVCVFSAIQHHARVFCGIRFSKQESVFWWRLQELQVSRFSLPLSFQCSCTTNSHRCLFTNKQTWKAS